MTANQPARLSIRPSTCQPTIPLAGAPLAHPPAVMSARLSGIPPTRFCVVCMPILLHSNPTFWWPVCLQIHLSIHSSKCIPTRPPVQHPGCYLAILSTRIQLPPPPATAHRNGKPDHSSVNCISKDKSASLLTYPPTNRHTSPRSLTHPPINPLSRLLIHLHTCTPTGTHINSEGKRVCAEFCSSVYHWNYVICLLSYSCQPWTMSIALTYYVWLTSHEININYTPKV